jgi:hypothetical protein
MNATREKHQVTYKDKPIRIAADFSTLKARRYAIMYLYSINTLFIYIFII